METQRKGLTRTGSMASDSAPRGLLLALAGAVLCVSAAAGADWPMFRGNPALTGVGEGALPDKPKLLWRFKAGGGVKSSPAIAGW